MDGQHSSLPLLIEPNGINYSINHGVLILLADFFVGADGLCSKPCAEEKIQSSIHMPNGSPTSTKSTSESDS